VHESGKSVSVFVYFIRIYTHTLSVERGYPYLKIFASTVENMVILQLREVVFK
jgi:hypothetical protein